MSMRGELISEEYKKMVWIHDRQGKEYACYLTDLEGKLRNREELSEDEKNNCLDLSTVLGDSW